MCQIDLAGRFRSNVFELELADRVSGTGLAPAPARRHRQHAGRTGIPVGVGIAQTKTLAKLANHTAKRLQAQTGGVVNITDPVKRDWVLRNTDVAEV
jgi:DNA polymerase V